MSNRPFVSALMSVYNGERWLKESINSMLNQTFGDFEFIIVNDGSTDDSLKIINSFQSKDERIRVFNKPNTGLADSLNYGIRHSRGEWIARIDADDICYPARLENQIKMAKEDRQLILVGTGLVFVDEHGKIITDYRFPRSHSRLTRNLTRGGPFFAHSSAFINSSALLLAGGYRSRIRRSQDHDLWLRLTKYGKIGCIDAPLVQVRMHSDQISREDGGKRVTLDSHVSKVSYWLKRFGYPDPVDEDHSDLDFEIFRDWVAKRIQENGVLEVTSFIQEAKLHMLRSTPTTHQVTSLSFFIARNPILFYRWVIMKTLGSGLPKKLAIEWSRRTG